MDRSRLKFKDLGLISYEEALQKQLQLADEVASHKTSSTILFCSHPAVVTLGRATPETDVLDWSGPTVNVSRGGRATYHGPSQLVIYPILDLTLNWSHLRSKDLHHLLRSMEDVVVRVLKFYNIEAQGQNTDPQFKCHGLEGTGVWVEGRKLASLGMAVKKWISYHGLALNVDHDPTAHKGINPCGFQTSVMTSMEKEAGRKVDRSELQTLLKQEFENLLLKEY